MGALEDRFAGLADGSSGDVEIERAFLRAMAGGYEKFCEKQRDYGRGNIARFGEHGVMVRTSDKLERLVRLLTSGNAPANEPIQDTWLDIGNYGFIGLMCREGTWPGMRSANVSA